MITFKAKKLLPLAVLGASFMSGGASALPVSELFFSQAAGWDSTGTDVFNPGSTGFTGLDFTGAPPADAPAGTNTDMSWCDQGQPVGSNIRCSSINIESYTDSSSPITLDAAFAADADGMWNEGDWWVIDTLTQTNEVLRTGSTIPDPLWIADTVANLRIFDDAARTNEVSGGPGFLDSRVAIEFWESNNRRQEENCVGANPLGTLCDDVYRVQAADFADVGFVLGDYIYEISFTLIPGPSTGGTPPAVIGQSLVCPDALNALCDDVVVDDGEIWIFTPEANPGTSSISVAMSWNARLRPVAAPAALALIGLGALSAGFAGRRRRRVA